jgi:phosphopantothenoylcysteine decarboxylase/phosphopantothenate--cysteine ligase
VDVQNSEEMLAAVLAAIPGADVLAMAAAVADFRPSIPAKNKLKRDAGIPEIHLEATPDILQRVAGVREKSNWPRFTVGFAAESRDLLANAQAKLRAKRLDMIAANDISAHDAGFEVDTNRITLLTPDGHAEALPLMTKTEVADRIMERVAACLKPESA